MIQSKLFICGNIDETYSFLKLYMNIGQKIENYEVIYSKKYINNDYEQFDEILTHFIHETNMESFDCISLACAGPIINDKVHFSNITWLIDKRQLEKTYSTKVFLLNDFEVCSHGAYMKAFQERL